MFPPRMCWNMIFFISPRTTLFRLLSFRRVEQMQLLPVYHLASMSDTRSPERFHTAEVAPPPFSPRIFPENCKCFATFPRQPFLSPVSYSSFVSFETMRCHFSPWIWKFHISHAAPFRWGDTSISLSLEIMQFLGRLIAFAVPATFDISLWLFHRYGGLLWIGLCEVENSLCQRENISNSLYGISRSV